MPHYAENLPGPSKLSTGGPMRTIWNGSISFGLVNIPVGLALATTPKAKQSDVSFRTLHRECGTPIRNKRWCPTHEREVGADEIVKGWEVAKGVFVLVEDADLEAIAQHDDSRSIDITRFVELDEVDPVYLDRTYYPAPATNPAQRRPYVLLLEAMRQAGMGGIGRFVLRGAEYFCLIRPKGDALLLETLFLAEDVRSHAEIDEAVAGTEVKEAELKLAQQVMDSLVADFDPAELRSQYRSDLRQMLEAKLDGQEIAKPEPVPETPSADLMEALTRSAEEPKARKAAKGSAAQKRAAPKSGSCSRRQPARKSASPGLL